MAALAAPKNTNTYGEGRLLSAAATFLAAFIPHHCLNAFSWRAPRTQASDEASSLQHRSHSEWLLP
jgi:hypothetical protein